MRTMNACASAILVLRNLVEIKGTSERVNAQVNHPTHASFCTLPYQASHTHLLHLDLEPASISFSTYRARV